ncbi:hypothetical protein, partial [Streptobacillus moniliformis]|uniref:hypothetical protein n=1 Tax=Streptobacillus moniliformis TaxID=34105 RepID=UPI000A42E596
KKKGKKGNITGLKDIPPNEKDENIAVNKKYIDNKIKTISNCPFDYKTSDDKKVVKIQDKKLYKEEDLNKHYYDENSKSYKPKNNGNGQQNGPTPLENKDVTVNVMPKNGTPISIGNVASILGEEATTTSDKAAEKVKDLIDKKDNLSDNSKNKVATGTDIKALAMAGL